MSFPGFKPQQGRVLLNGEISLGNRGRSAICCRGSSASYRTIQDNVALPLLSGMRKGSAPEAAAMFDEFGRGTEAKYPSQLSRHAAESSSSQNVYVSQDVALLDEPFSAGHMTKHRSIIGICRL